MKKLLSLSMAVALSLSIIVPTNLQAAGTVKLSTKSTIVTVGKTKKVKLLNNKKTVKWSVSNHNIAMLSTSEKQVKIKALKKGTSYLNAKVGSKTYKCKVTVKESNPSQQSNNTSTASEKKNIEVNKLLCEDENIAIILKEIKNGKIYFTYKNKTLEDVRIDLTYIELNGVGYYNDYAGKVVASGKTRDVELEILDENANEIRYSFDSGKICGTFDYLNTSNYVDDYYVDGKIKFDDIEI